MGRILEALHDLLDRARPMHTLAQFQRSLLDTQDNGLQLVLVAALDNLLSEVVPERVGHQGVEALDRHSEDHLEKLRVVTLDFLLEETAPSLVSCQHIGVFDECDKFFARHKLVPFQRQVCGLQIKLLENLLDGKVGHIG